MKIGMDWKIQGQKVEAKFQFEVLNRDLVISKPFGDNSKYDFITDYKGLLKRVQVKSVGTPSKFGYQCQLSSTNGSKRLRYSKKDIDIFAAHIIPLDVWYFIPVEFVTASTVYLCPEGASKAKYEKFKNK